MVKLNRNERRATQKMIIAQLTDENKRLRQALDSLTKEVAATTEAFNNFKALTEREDADEKWIDDSDREELTHIDLGRHGLGESGHYFHTDCEKCREVAAPLFEIKATN